jgi:hypothetical protein
MKITKEFAPIMLVMVGTVVVTRLFLEGEHAG